ACQVEQLSLVGTKPPTSCDIGDQEMRQMRKLTSLLFVALLCGTRQMAAQESGTGQQADTIRELQTKMDELRTQMTKIQSELDAIQGDKVLPTGSIVSAPKPALPQLTPEQEEEAIGAATEHHQTFNEDEQDAPRLYNAPLEPDEPGYFLLPGTRTMLRLNGSARTDFIYDFRTTALSDSFVPSSLPIPSVSGQGSFTASIRGSRASADFLIPVGDKGAARTFIQFDF